MEILFLKIKSEIKNRRFEEKKVLSLLNFDVLLKTTTKKKIMNEIESF